MILDEKRKQIDKIDKQLVELFEKRMEVIYDVAEYKKQNNLPILDEKREYELIQKNKKFLKNQEFNPYLEELFQVIFDLSKEYQINIIEK